LNIVTENYKIAEKRLQKLKDEPFAFSTDVDGLSPTNKAEKFTKEYRKTALQKLFQVPVIEKNLQQNLNDNGELISFINIKGSLHFNIFYIRQLLLKLGNSALLVTSLPLPFSSIVTFFLSVTGYFLQKIMVTVTHYLYKVNFP